MYLGGDLHQTRQIFAKSAFTTTKLIAVDQSGIPAVQVTGGQQPVWMSKQADGSIYIAIYNLNGPSTRSLFPGAISVSATPWGARCVERCQSWPIGGCVYHDPRGHGSRLFEGHSLGRQLRRRPARYMKQRTQRSAATFVSSCSACSGGAKLSYLGVAQLNTRPSMST